MEDGGAVERLARALHGANIVELAARGIDTVAFPFEGDREVDVVVAWEALDPSARRWYEGNARQLVESGVLVRVPDPGSSA